MAGQWEDGGMRFILRLIINAAAIAFAWWLIPTVEITPTGDAAETLLALGVVSLIFTLVNSLVKPIVRLLSLPLYILTLGLFFLIVNAAMLLLTSWITGFTSFGLEVGNFGWAIVAALVIAIASWILQLLLGDQKKSRR